MSIRAVVAARIRGRRTEIAMTQEQLAKAAKLSVAYISKLERGSVNISLDNLEQVAHALKTSVEGLVSGSNTPSHMRQIPSDIRMEIENAIEILNSLTRSSPEKRKKRGKKK